MQTICLSHFLVVYDKTTIWGLSDNDSTSDLHSESKGLIPLVSSSDLITLAKRLSQSAYIPLKVYKMPD